MDVSNNVFIHICTHKGKSFVANKHSKWIKAFWTKCIYTSIQFQRAYPLRKSSTHATVTEAARQTSLSHFLPPAPLSQLAPPSPGWQFDTSSMPPALMTQHLHCIFQFLPYSSVLFFFSSIWKGRQMQVKLSSTSGVHGRRISKLQCVAVPHCPQSWLKIKSLLQLPAHHLKIQLN